MNDLQRTCGAETSTGNPCKRAPIIGGTRCILHGGASPEAQRKAQEALIGARLSAARVLYDIVESYERDGNRDPCPTCGFVPRGDLNPIIRAAVAVLDRTGMGPSMTIGIEKPVDTTPVGVDEAIARGEKLLTFLYAERDARDGRTPRGDRTLPEVIESDTLVPDDDDSVEI